MDTIGTVNVSWAHGLSSGIIHHIEEHVICYICGNVVKFVNTFNKEEKVFTVPGNGISAVATCPGQRKFAVAEASLSPKIYICDYPTMKIIGTLEGGAEVEYKHLAFSCTESYLVSSSGIPDFSVVVWDWSLGSLICRYQMRIDTNITSLSFNPMNWHEICACGPDTVYVFSLENCDKSYVIDAREIVLPETSGNIEKDDENDFHYTSQPTGHLQLSISAKANLVDPNANDFKPPHQRKPLVKPRAHCWSNKGLLYIGCAGGQLLSIQAESGYTAILLSGNQVSIITNPSQNLLEVQLLQNGMVASVTYSQLLGVSDITAGKACVSFPIVLESMKDSKVYSRVDTPVFSPKQKKIASFQSSASSSEDLTGEVVEGMFSTLLFNLQGLFCGGSDGALRKIVIDKNGIKITKEYEGSSKILTASFSQPSFNSIVFTTSTGSVNIFNLKIGNCRTLFQTHSTQFIGAGYTNGGNVCVSCRDDGMIELWESEFGAFIARFSINQKVTAFDVCSSIPLAAVGTQSGAVYHVDISHLQNPKVVSVQYLHREPVNFLQYTPLGLHLICCSMEERHIFVINAKPSSKFKCSGFIDCYGTIKSINRIQHGDDRTHFAVVVIPLMEDDEETSVEPSTSDRLIIFSIPNDDSLYVNEHYASSLKNFKDNFINRLTFDLTIPLDSAAISTIDSDYHVFAIGHDDKKLLEFKFPMTQDDSTSIHNPSHEHDGHQLQNGVLCMSPHAEWIFSYAPDGNLILRDKKTPKSRTIVNAHSCLSGGVSSATLSPDGQRILSTGNGDGSLACRTWNLTHKGNVVMSNALEFARNLDMKLRSIAEKEEDSLKNMPAFELSDLDTTSNTWYEEQMSIADKNENLEYDAVKRHLKTSIDHLRKTILEMMSENKTRPEMEQLNQEEYNLDVEQQQQLQEMEEKRVEDARKNIEFDNLAEKYLKYIMQKEFWDDMSVKGLAVKAFNSSTSVTNYAMKDVIQSEMTILNRISRIRAAEIEELKARKEIVEISTGQTGMTEDEEDDEEGAADSEGQLSLHGSVGPKCGGENELFYSQFDMHTREEKINQILFLKDAISRIKLAFNKEFMSIYQNKEQEIGRSKEKNIRIREIMQDLEVDAANVKDPSMSIDEKPEKILTVADEEVTIERVLSLEQQKQLYEEERQEQARLEAAKKDNKRERGLQDMMGGVLEVKKEDVLKQDVPIPEFFGEKPENEWTEEEKKIVKEFEKKQKDLQEEREKYRKNLENELKKLQQTVVDGIIAFDEQLLQLYNRKVKIEMVINQEESKILRLVSAILVDDEINTQELQLNLSVQLAQKRKVAISHSEAEMRKLVDEHREMYDSILAEDKLLDRAFKRDFSDIPLAVVDSLYKLFKRRPRIQRAPGALDHANDFNPYSVEARSQTSLPPGIRSLPVVDTSHATLSALKELDNFNNAPEGVDEVVWHRLTSSRQTKVESELRVKKYTSSLAEMTRYLQHLQDNVAMASNEIEGLAQQQKRLSEDRMKNSLNLEIQFLLKQGQVEVDTGNFLPEFHDSILIHRPVVEDLNATIKGLGEQKVAAMTECKDFKKGIHQLEWERKRMTMQMEDLKNKARHVQMLKLAKDLQLYLSDDNHHAQQAKQMQVLEETLSLQEKHLEKNMNERRTTVRNLERTIRHKEADNSSLEWETEEIHVCVSERKNIDDINAAERAKHTADSRLRGIMQRRKLVDLAKAQAQEVAVLRAEVERLRMKTFPALQTSELS